MKKLEFKLTKKQKSQIIKYGVLSSFVGIAAIYANRSFKIFQFEDWKIFLMGAVIMCLVLLVKEFDKKKYRTGKEYGSARWGTAEDIKPFMSPNPRNNIILTQTESLTMDNRAAVPKNSRNKNVLVIGGSGSGKTRFFVKPNLMQQHSSYVVTDPKGTVLIECGKMLEKGGYKIKVLNTIDFKKSMKYNPFTYIKSEKDILKFVNTLIANTNDDTKTGGDGFWEKAETLLYTALVGLIHYEALPDEKNISTLLELIDSMEVRENDETFKNPVDLLFDELAEEKPRHFAVRQYKKYKLAAGETAKSILVSCGARLAPFDIQELRDLMEYDEMELDTLGDKKTALFIIISDTDTTFNFIAALLYSQLFNFLCDKADNEYNGSLPIHVRCILDEFANIGKIPRFEKLIATIRSRNISVNVILQAQSQLKAIYKDDMNTIIGNCDTTLFLGGKEKETLKELTEILGKETIDSLSTNHSRGSQESAGTNYQKLGRDLIDISEISTMDGGKCILQVRGTYPFFSDKYDITKHPNYKLLSDENPKNSFDIMKYINTNLRAKQNELFDVAHVKM